MLCQALIITIAERDNYFPILLLLLIKSSQNGLVCRLSPEFCGKVVQIGERDAFLVPLQFLCSIFPIAQRADSLKYFQTAVWQHLNM